MVKAAHGAVVDASFISCAARPDSALEVDEEDEIVAASQSADSEARCSKKGHQYYFSYRAYAVVDAMGISEACIQRLPINLSKITFSQF
jgi:hypothetical protein